MGKEKTENSDLCSVIKDQSLSMPLLILFLMYSFHSINITRPWSLWDSHMPCLYNQQNEKKYFCEGRMGCATSDYRWGMTAFSLMQKSYYRCHTSLRLQLGKVVTVDHLSYIYLTGLFIFDPFTPWCPISQTGWPSQPLLILALLGVVWFWN